MAVENKKTQKEILTCASITKIFYKNIQTMKECVKRGVTFRLICNFNTKYLNSYKEYLKTGIEIRVLNQKKFGTALPRMSIYDKEKARLTIGQPEVKNREEYITLWTESKVFSKMLRNHFMNMWKQCTPVEKYINKS